jgi:CheY-like chemotaxis protein
MNEKLHIMVVDDDEFNSIIIKKFLEKNFPKIFLVSDPSQAKQALEKNSIHFIFTDIHMDGNKESGIELLHFVKKNYPGIIVVAITGYALYNDREKYLAIGFDEYVKKPYEREQLIELVKSFIR